MFKKDPKIAFIDWVDRYATAKDEFEIASEETDKKTVYAAGDREAAQTALTELKEVYERSIRESTPEVAGDISKRAGQRIRELEAGIQAMEERAIED